MVQIINQRTLSCIAHMRMQDACPIHSPLAQKYSDSFPDCPMSIAPYCMTNFLQNWPGSKPKSNTSNCLRLSSFPRATNNFLKVVRWWDFTKHHMPSYFEGPADFIVTFASTCMEVLISASPQFKPAYHTSNSGANPITSNRGPIRTLPATSRVYLSASCIILPNMSWTVIS